MAFWPGLVKVLSEKEEFSLNMLYLSYLNKEVQTNENI